MKRRRRKRTKNWAAACGEIGDDIDNGKRIGARMEQSAMALAMAEKEEIGGSVHKNVWQLVDELQRSVKEPAPRKLTAAFEELAARVSVAAKTVRKGKGGRLGKGERNGLVCCLIIEV